MGVVKGRQAAGRALAQLPQGSCRAVGPGEGQLSPRGTALCSHGSVPEQAGLSTLQQTPQGCIAGSQGPRVPRPHRLPAELWPDMPQPTAIAET